MIKEEKPDGFSKIKKQKKTYGFQPKSLIIQYSSIIKQVINYSDFNSRKE
jgi:hypothetical protein